MNDSNVRYVWECLFRAVLILSANMGHPRERLKSSWAHQLRVVLDRIEDLPDSNLKERLEKLLDEMRLDRGFSFEKASDEKIRQIVIEVVSLYGIAADMTEIASG